MTVLVPDMSAELSVIVSAVLSGSAKVTLTVARPSLNITLLPFEQLPVPGYSGAVPSEASSGPVKVTHFAPV